jgi:protein phosphatase
MLEMVGPPGSLRMRLADPETQQIQSRVGAYVDCVQQALLEHRQRDPKTAFMGMTWTSAHILGRKVMIVHSGDSRLPVAKRSPSADDLGRDSGPESDRFGTRPENRKDIRSYPAQQSRWQQRESFGPDHYPELKPNDRILLCSDGIFDMIPDEDIAIELSSPQNSQAACDGLSLGASGNGGNENVSSGLAGACSRDDRKTP